jgi:hypothetical protein
MSDESKPPPPTDSVGKSVVVAILLALIGALLMFAVFLLFRFGWPLVKDLLI